MREAEKLTDRDRLDAALKLVHGVHLDDAMIRAHVMRPENVVGVPSDRRRDDEQAPAGKPGPEPGGPEELLGYALDVPGFVQTIEFQFDGCVAGYAMRLNMNGAPIVTLECRPRAERCTPDQHRAEERYSASAVGSIRPQGSRWPFSIISRTSARSVASGARWEAGGLGFGGAR